MECRSVMKVSKGIPLEASLSMQFLKPSYIYIKKISNEYTVKYTKLPMSHSFIQYKLHSISYFAHCKLLIGWKYQCFLWNSNHSTSTSKKISNHPKVRVSGKKAWEQGCICRIFSFSYNHKANNTNV